MPKPVTIRDIKTILTQPTGPRWVVVKVITSEPGVYGLGCGSFPQRYQAVYSAIQDNLKPFLVGWDVSHIEEIFQMSTVQGSWRNCSVLENAISGIDMALWDIQGKLANAPVYQLLGGKCREAAAVYAHASGQNPQEVTGNVAKLIEQGYRHVDLQMNGVARQPEGVAPVEGGQSGGSFDPRSTSPKVLKMIELVRSQVGEEIELLHDLHEQLSPVDALQFTKEVEKYRLFFLAEILAAEDLEYFRLIRQQCSTPLAMGKRFNNPHEWRMSIEERWIDFLRTGISQIGGITPARNVAMHANTYGIRTAWHGSNDVSPVGHAANLHLDLWAPNFGLQEWPQFPELVYEIFPGLPNVRNGYLYPNDRPGLGIDIDEKLAARY